MKYTVITGASSGIGYATALAFAERGKNLILAARREDKLEEVKDEVLKINKDLAVVLKPVDLSIAENVHAFYDSLKGFELETWINNAGFGNFASIGEQNLTKIESMLHLNIGALTILSSLFVRDYEHVEGAQIINVSSVGGYIMISDFVTYSATKFYVNAFTEGLAQELKLRGSKMQAKVLAPAVTKTEFELRSLERDEFQYEGHFPKFHTSKEMAGFMLALFDSDKTVGIVDESTYDFYLKDPIFPFRGFENK
ncbi:SDR family NAD(P)-dependent oxidoreductase [Paenibacillus sp. DMB5]|uniref:SDR family NAD(P)-dependent oxidoreductase n=1 Tax=Paenibacillus sp. DMB5 TaxID=1780103 RepID=UPI00076C8077|nr:SDR family NAD(P)-dependent oxidoreductase [Paenibacillus sp. DMB5]KUP22561.1 oxidoreductase [Paenibacillus sp. DMB5]